jgi:glycosyltransferase involved in cell wall biosynthesis
MGRRVSVCVPIFNGASHLQECLQSVAAQTFRDIEILVVDDASTDDSLEIARVFAQADDRVRVEVNVTNRGLVGNWNRCLELARGTWIKFVFQDDFIHPDCLELMLQRGSSARPFVACKRDVLFEEVGPDEEAVFREHLRRSDIGLLFSGRTWITSNEISRHGLQRGGNFVGEPTAVMLHREVFERFGYFREELVHLCDWEYWLRVGSRAGLAYEPTVLATFRYHPGATTMRVRSARRFAMDVLDPLLVGYALGYEPQYARLRRSAPLVALKLRTDIGLRLAAVATQAMHVTEGGDVAAEWARVARANPEIGRLATGRQVKILRIWRRVRRQLGLARRAILSALRR